MPLAAAIIPAAGAIGGALIANKGAKDATKAQTKAANQANAEERRQYDLSRADQMPWLDAGRGALSQMAKLNAGDYSSFQESPDYQFTLDQGLKFQDRSAASRGGLYSGGHSADLMKYGQGLASQQYNNYYNKLQSMADQGQTKANALGALGANYANAYGNNLGQAANARASGYANNANIWGSTLGGLANTTSNYFNDKGGWYLGNNPGKG